MVTTLKKTALAFFSISVVVLPALLYGSDSEIAAVLHEDIAKGFCVPEVLVAADAQFSGCESALELPLRLCAKETGMYDYIASSELPEQEWNAQLEAAGHRLTTCLFSELRSASETSGNPNRAIYSALIEHHSELREVKEPPSEFFTDAQVEAGELDIFLTEQAQAMNDSLPMMVDDLSRLERVTYANRIFRHYYTVVGVAPDELRNEFSPEVVQQFFATTACDYEASRNAMEEGVVFEYEFRTDGGVKHTEVSVTAKDCEGSNRTLN